MQILSGILRAKLGITSNPKLKWAKLRYFLDLVFAADVFGLNVSLETCFSISRKILFGRGCLRISLNPTPIPGSKIKHQVKTAQIISSKKKT